MATLREVKEAHNWDLETAEARARDLMEKYKSYDSLQPPHLCAL